MELPAPVLAAIDVAIWKHGGDRESFIREAVAERIQAVKGGPWRLVKRKAGPPGTVEIHARAEQGGAR